MSMRRRLWYSWPSGLKHSFKDVQFGNFPLECMSVEYLPLLKLNNQCWDVITVTSLCLITIDEMNVPVWYSFHSTDVCCPILYDGCFIPHILATQHGRQFEPIAANTYKGLKSALVNDFKFRECGLVLQCLNVFPLLYGLVKLPWYYQCYKSVSTNAHCKILSNLYLKILAAIHFFFNKISYSSVLTKWYTVIIVSRHLYSTSTIIFALSYACGATPPRMVYEFTFHNEQTSNTGHQRYWGPTWLRTWMVLCSKSLYNSQTKKDSIGNFLKMKMMLKSWKWVQNTTPSIIAWFL